MSVPNALTIIDGMTEIARADFADLDPSRRPQAPAIRRLHWPLYYAREYYFRNRKPPADRLKHAAAGAKHALALQHECSPFDTHWYCDLPEELGGVFWDVLQQGINFPGSEYFICHRGNDRQEGSISVVRTARGQGGVLDIEQCRRRFSVATQIDSIFEEAPRYKPRRKGSNIEDNMTPADAGTCRLPIDLRPIWDAGLKLAQDDLGSDLNAHFAEGVALLSPRGVLLKPVLPPVDGEDTDDMHDAFFVDEDIDDHVLQATHEVEEQFASPPILLDFEGQGRSKQYVLNVLHNDGTAADPRDHLMRAIQGSHPGLPKQPTLNLDPESGPIVGDTFATLVCCVGKLSLGLFYLRTL